MNLEPPQFKINLKDAMDILKVQNVNRKCINCGKYVPVINAVMGQHVTCPECGKGYTVKQEVKFIVVIDPVEV
jgi:rRNA maturation endonuclease Nob1